MNLRILLSGVLMYVFAFTVFATHNKGGSISYKHIQGHEYEIRVIIYTNPLSLVTRDSLPVTLWKAGTTMELKDEFWLTKTTTVPVSDNIHRNLYSENIILPDDGNFLMALTDPNRIVDVLNISGSINTQFHIHTYLRHDVADPNSNAQKLFSPIFNVQTGDTLRQSWAMADPDGDCLTFDLVNPLQAYGIAVPGYYNQSPDLYSKVNKTTGEIEIHSGITGIYSFAVRVNEWRNGQLTGSAIHEFLVHFQDHPAGKLPHLEPSSWSKGNYGSYEYHIQPGDTLELVLEFEVANSDSFDLVAAGEVFELSNFAEFHVDAISSTRLTGTFRWIPQSQDQRNLPYRVTFRGVMNFTGPGNSVATFGRDATLLIFTGQAEDCEALFTGISNKPELSHKIYPNPAKDYLRIELENYSFVEKRFKLKDLTGRVVLDMPVGGNEPMTIPLPGLAPGIYFYKLGEFSGKVIIGY